MDGTRRIPKPKPLRIAAFSALVMAVAAAAAGFALEKSLPYRIGPANYARFLWAARLSIAAVPMTLLAMGLGIASRQRLPILLGACGLVVSLLFMPNWVHSGANPEFWCRNNIIRIERAKGALADQKRLTNGTAVTAEDISPLIQGGFQSLKCYNDGNYIIGPIGTASRCTVHGSFSEILRDNPQRP